MKSNNYIIAEDKSNVQFNDINMLTKKVGWGESYFSSEAAWKHTLAASAHIAYVKKNNELICFGRILEDGQMCMFYDICVHPDYQHNGLGSLLMNHLINKIKDKNYVSIGLFVWSGNATASKFYSKFGFETAPAMELKKLMKNV